MDILVFSDRITPRVEYMVDHILGTMLGLKYIIAQSEEEFNRFNGPKIAYSKGYFENFLNVTPCGLLFESGIEEQNMAFFQWEGMPAFFAVHETSDIPFDLFAASFFLITRYEEYLPFKADEHSRFPASESYAYRMGFLQQPLVDLWVKRFARLLQEKFPQLLITSKPFVFVPTIDIDNAYAFKHKGIARTLFGTLKALANLRFSELFRRTLVYFNILGDPYNTYKLLFRTLKSNSNSIWFILSGGSGKWDRNLDVNSKALSKLIQRIGNHFQLGLHPSYHSADNPQSIKIEKKALEQVANRPVEMARQHFLKIKFPSYFISLIENEIFADYSLGYSNALGFSASTCTPFPFYNLETDTPSKLTIVPFSIMDRALEKSFTNPLKAFSETMRMAADVAKLGGTFVLVWHNETLVDLRWRNCFTEIINNVNKLTFED